MRKKKDSGSDYTVSGVFQPRNGSASPTVLRTYVHADSAEQATEKGMAQLNGSHGGQVVHGRTKVTGAPVPVDDADL
ncbi:hypothetical protein [Kitasatospora sp. GP82]|uniref:hypothetical protein n=1 Tax=Kitasatospora sp. GP82 TaxID=3035089 RepID=UPI002472F177|nr:hypothetical protein [Kitasatospora sp. GP82]MDH6130538.1 putative enzyme related to lactoylglutathione lyase [Kitasatospora sp. GP82]